MAYLNADNGATDSLLVTDGQGMPHRVSSKADRSAHGEDQELSPQPAQAVFKDVFNVPAAVAAANASVSAVPSSLISGDSFDKMMQAPSHILPPPSLMFRVFLKDVHKSQADTQSREVPTPSPSTDPTLSTATKTTPNPSGFPISGIPTKASDLAAVISADARLGSFEELGRLFQAESSEK